MPLAFDPFILHAREATPLGEARAVAVRMRGYASDQGNAQYLRKLIYEDSATIVSLIPQIEAAAGADSDITRDVYQAASICGSVGECGGNIGMWALVPMYADKLDVALDLLEGGEPPPIQTLPAATASPDVMQDGGVLRCSTGAWSGNPTSYAYQWRRAVTDVGSDSPIYIMVAGDIGQAFSCNVTATNSVGSATAISNTVTPTTPVTQRHA